MRIARVTVDAILPLRHRVLRAGLPPEAARFDGDDEPSTLHFAVLVDGEPVSCLTLCESRWGDREAWQLRGMATDANHQRRGHGRRLLDHAVTEASLVRPTWGFWCNARVTAVGFYERAGWTVESDEFDIPTAGPHVKMRLGAGEDRHDTRRDTGAGRPDQRDAGSGSAAADR